MAYGGAFLPEVPKTPKDTCVSILQLLRVQELWQTLRGLHSWAQDTWTVEIAFATSAGRHLWRLDSGRSFPRGFTS